MQIGTMAIVPARYNPKTNFVTFAKGKPEGAAKGALAGGGFMALGVVMSGTNPYTAIMLPFFAGVGAVAGGIAGVAESQSARNVQQTESALDKEVEKLDAQHALSERLAAIVHQETWVRLRSSDAPGPTNDSDTPTYSRLRANSIDTVFEVAINEIGFKDSGCGLVGPTNLNFCKGKTRSTFRFFANAKARLVRVSDGTTLFTLGFSYQSPWREAAQWQANDGRMFAEELEIAYRDLADRMNDEVILVTTVALPTPSIYLPWNNPQFGACWLAPVYPKTEHVTSPFEALHTFTRDGCSGLGSHGDAISPLYFSTVDSTRPTLRWSSFPRDMDREKLDPAMLQIIGNVSYDLKIWEVEGCERGKLVYERTGLSEPAHQLEELLRPGQRYFWSVRARFTENAQPSATRWASFNPNGCYGIPISDTSYYRFITP